MTIKMRADRLRYPGCRLSILFVLIIKEAERICNKH